MADFLLPTSDVCGISREINLILSNFNELWAIMFKLMANFHIHSSKNVWIPRKFEETGRQAANKGKTSTEVNAPKPPAPIVECRCFYEWSRLKVGKSCLARKILSICQFLAIITRVFQQKLEKKGERNGPLQRHSKTKSNMASLATAATYTFGILLVICFNNRWMTNYWLILIDHCSLIVVKSSFYKHPQCNKPKWLITESLKQNKLYQRWNVNI